MKQSREVFWWSLFSAGGVMSALFVPAIVVTTGFILPFRGEGDGIAQYQHVHGIVAFWLVRLVLLGVIGLSLIHCAHRIRHMLMDVGLRGAAAALSVICYGAAFAGIVVAGLIVGRL